MTMEKPMNVCVLVGSLRKASLNGMLANALMSLAPSSMKLETVEIGQLPFFNQDLETAATPAPWIAFRERVKAADAVLFVTPNIIGQCRQLSRMHWMWAPGRMEAASGTGSLVRLSAVHRARSGLSAPIIISGSRSCF
jgi:hypothetical protein